MNCPRSFKNGYPQKDTHIITNCLAIIMTFGTWDKKHYPDAPDPRYLCRQETPCLCFNCHPKVSKRGGDDDMDAADTAPYVPRFAAMLAECINQQMRTNVASRHLK